LNGKKEISKKNETKKPIKKPSESRGKENGMEQLKFRKKTGKGIDPIQRHWYQGNLDYFCHSPGEIDENEFPHFSLPKKPESTFLCYNFSRTDVCFYHD